MHDNFVNKYEVMVCFYLLVQMVLLLQTPLVVYHLSPEYANSAHH